MGEVFNIRDYKLMNAIRSRAPHYQDGIVRVVTRNGHLSVFCYERRIFHYVVKTGFFEATTYGENHRWLRDKLNACLTGCGIMCRVYTDEFGKLRVTNRNGDDIPAYLFNSKFLEVA
jgi:hypothetical protein